VTRYVSSYRSILAASGNGRPTCSRSGRSPDAGTSTAVATSGGTEGDSADTCVHPSTVSISHVEPRSAMSAEGATAKPQGACHPRASANQDVKDTGARPMPMAQSKTLLSSHDP
jgi:hypothetical protein